MSFAGLMDCKPRPFPSLSKLTPCATTIRVCSIPIHRTTPPHSTSPTAVAVVLIMGMLQLRSAYLVAEVVAQNCTTSCLRFSADAWLDASSGLDANRDNDSARKLWQGHTPGRFRHLCFLVADLHVRYKLGGESAPLILCEGPRQWNTGCNR